MLKVIIDFDGTLTAEETQVSTLAERSLDTLATEMEVASRDQLCVDYANTQEQILREPHLYRWEVNGLVASYATEGAFILNTSTLQVMLSESEVYSRRVSEVFARAEYDPITDCTNHLFHRHTAGIEPVFREGAHDVLSALIQHIDRQPIILTNSLGDKVSRHISMLDLPVKIPILGDTRQYAMSPDWDHRFDHPGLGPVQVWPISDRYRVDLRRPEYYRALKRVSSDGSALAVVADTFSLPGAVALMMGIPFFLLRTSYTPEWCIQATAKHPLGCVLDNLAHLEPALDRLNTA